MIKIHVLPVCLFGLVGGLSAEGLPGLESFEQGVPGEWKCAGGKLGITGEHLQDGKQALRWDCASGDVLDVRPGAFGNVSVSTGYGGYSRSAVVVPLYLSGVGAGKLELEFLSGDEVAGVVEVPLVHKGWQKLVYHYSWNSGISWKNPGLRGKLDGLRLRAADVPAGMYVVLDAVRYNVPMDFRDARHAVTAEWKPKKPDFSAERAPDAKDLEKVDLLEKSVLPGFNEKAPRKFWEDRLAACRKVIAEKNYSTGHPLESNLPTYFSFLNGVAGDYCSCPDVEIRKALADEFLAVNDWLMDQGLVVDGALGKANNYIGREYVDAVAKMRSPLAERGVLDAALSYIKWSYGYDERMFSETIAAESMDYLHNEAFRFLRIALMHGDPAERWHHVERFRKVLSQQLVASVKPDGSLFHHGFHYFAYGTMGMGSISGALERLSAAGLPVEERALDAVKLGVMRMRWYAGGEAVMFSLCGRHPSGKQMLASPTFLNLAKAYAPYRDGRWDSELVAAYLRLAPQQSGKPEFQGIVAEAAPQGHVAMPYAGLSLHRREGWMAGLKVYGKGIAAGESYANANRFGLYLSNGFLELHTHPQPLPTVHGSGVRPDEGWNWCAPDGATTIHAPLSAIANGNGTRSEYGSQTFAGGLSHDRRNGVSALHLSSQSQANVCRAQGTKGGPFEARKSWFFFDNRIVCLGSGIRVDAVEHAVRTTLFQKFLTPDHAVTRAGGEVIEAGESVAARDLTGKSVLADPYGNVYVTTDPVRLTVGRQDSRSGYDQKDTNGKYATAWIDHGKNPVDAGYEYAVIVQGGEQAVKSLEAGKDLPYQVLRKDNAVHVVRDKESRSTGFAAFEGNVDLAGLKTPLQKIDQPCLVMAEERDGGLCLSLTHPAPRDGESGTKPVTVHLEGRYEKTGEIPPGVSMESEEGGTRITAEIAHGESVTVNLTEISSEKKLESPKGKRARKHK